MVRPNFVSKTYDIVDDPKTDHIISWINNGDASVVWKPVELAKHVFPKYFTHTNFCSFIRQLNEYGFSKHNFHKDDKSLHMQIKRRKKFDIERKRRPKIYIARTTPPTSGNPSEELKGPSNASPIFTDILVALKCMRTKVELSAKSIYAAKLKEEEAKKIWKDASKIVKDKEAQNQKLREQLFHMVQENSIIEYNLSEELEMCKKALDQGISSTSKLMDMQAGEGSLEDRLDIDRRKTCMHVNGGRN